MAATPLTLSRRRLIQLSAGAAASAALAATPWRVRAAAPLVNPYRGSIPLASPLPAGSFALANNWHEYREGPPAIWSHRTKRYRLHDGVDLLPSSSTLPPVFSPLPATVASVAVAGTVSETPGAAPPWAYPAAGVYGNYVWLRSDDPASAGYFVFLCHLQDESVIRSLTPGQAVSPATRLGLLGDSGNAVGSPQLHLEIHYPSGSTFTCTACKPKVAGRTSINPHASLAAATPRA